MFNIDFTAVYSSNRVSGANLRVTGFNFLFEERDVFVNDKVAILSGNTSYSTPVGPTGISGTIPITLGTVSPGQLNVLCSPSCSTRRGFVAEAGSLEFTLNRSVSYLDVAFSGFGTVTERVNLLGQVLAPEPPTVLLIASGLIGFLWICKRRRLYSVTP